MLIVICSKDMVKEEVKKQGQSLVCWFEQTMESGDASNEEASLVTKKRKDLSRNAWLEVISMLVGMKTEDVLKKMFSNKVWSWQSPKCSTWHTAQFTDYGNEQSACVPQA